MKNISEPAVCIERNPDVTIAYALITLKQVVAATTLSRSTIYRMISQREFPLPVDVSPGRSAFYRHEVEGWLAAKASSRVGEAG